MTSSARPSNYQQSPRDPNMALILSILLPGLGQLYNGETRKGLLFLLVSAINLTIFLLLIFVDPLLRTLVEIGQSMHVKPNKELVLSLAQAQMGSPASIVVIGLFLAYVAYAARDAYDHAALIQRKHIYPEYVIEMPEATSGSYIFHFSVLVSCFILAFFFLIPPPPRTQVTDIEFIQNQPPTPKKIVSHRRAPKASEASGRHNPKEEVRAPSPAPKAPSQPSPQQTPAKPEPTPTPQPTPTPTPRPMPMARPMPTPTPTPSPSPSPSPSPRPSPSPMPTPTPTAHPAPMPTPFAAPNANPSPVPSPAPAPMTFGKGGSPSPAPAPKLGIGGGAGNSPSPAPAPISSINTGGGGIPTPVPVAGGGGSPNRGGGTGPSPAPAPTRSTSRGGGGGGGGPAIAVAPSVPRPSGGGGGEGVKGNPDPNSNPGGRPSVAAQADVDFGPYMADLQRRIKRAWFPPKGNESKRVVVVFKVHTGGELSNLRIDRSSGLAIADQAALKAVENAAPFRPLPAGAPADVDIQFTFDYNVFGGGGVGRMRQF